MTYIPPTPIKPKIDYRFGILTRFFKPRWVVIGHYTMVPDLYVGVLTYRSARYVQRLLIRTSSTLAGAPKHYSIKRVKDL